MGAPLFLYQPRSGKAAACCQGVPAALRPARAPLETPYHSIIRMALFWSLRLLFTPTFLVIPGLNRNLLRCLDYARHDLIKTAVISRQPRDPIILSPPPTRGPRVHPQLKKPSCRARPGIPPPQIYFPQGACESLSLSLPQFYRAYAL